MLPTVYLQYPEQPVRADAPRIETFDLELQNSREAIACAFGLCYPHTYGAIWDCFWRIHFGWYAQLSIMIGEHRLSRIVSSLYQPPNLSALHAYMGQRLGTDDFDIAQDSLMGIEDVSYFDPATTHRGQQALQRLSEQMPILAGTLLRPQQSYTVVAEECTPTVTLLQFAAHTKLLRLFSTLPAFEENITDYHSHPRVQGVYRSLGTQASIQRIL